MTRRLEEGFLCDAMAHAVRYMRSRLLANLAPFAWCASQTRTVAVPAPGAPVRS